MGFKSGANFSDQVRIKALDKQGFSIDEISSHLLIEKSVVISFVIGTIPADESDDSEEDE